MVLKPGGLWCDDGLLVPLEEHGIYGTRIEQVNLTAKFPKTSALILYIFAALDSNCRISGWHAKTLNISGSGNFSFVVEDSGMDKVSISTIDKGIVNLKLSKLKELTATAAGHSRISITLKECELVHVKELGDGKVIVDRTQK